MKAYNIIEGDLHPLSFHYKNRSYSIEFRNMRLINLIGKSGTGKSLLLESLESCEGKIEFFGWRSNRLSISYKNTEGLDIIKEGMYKGFTLIVIDNAEVLLDKEVDQIIANDIEDPHSNVYWIIIGRGYHRCSERYTLTCSLESEYNKDTDTWEVWNKFEDY